MEMGCCTGQVPGSTSMPKALRSGSGHRRHAAGAWRLHGLATGLVLHLLVCMPHPVLAQRAAQLSVASPEFDATYYHLNLMMAFSPESPAKDTLQGDVVVQGRVVGEPLRTLVLDFSNVMRVDSLRSEGGDPLPYTHTEDALHIDLGHAVPVGERVAVEVYYHGHPDPSHFGTFETGRRTGDLPYAWTLSEPYGAKNWWPGKDHPADKADSVRVTVTVPEGLRVASNGVLVDSLTAGGQVTYDWVERYPIASYLVAFAAGPYEVFRQEYVRPDTLAAQIGAGSFPILNYAYTDAPDMFEGRDIFHGWKRIVDIMAVQEYWFGSYPFSAEKYGHAQFTWSGGMEHQTMGFLSSNSVSLMSHELSHQWFGDLITMRFWPHLWLNEGFATYAELLYWQARSDLYPGIYESEFQKYYERARLAPGTLVVQDTTSENNLFLSTRVYAKGGMVLHMLRGIVGDDTFREILHAYAGDPDLRYGNATTADFERVAEAVSGRDLDAFFRQWVTSGTGYPTYAVHWGYTEDASGYAVQVDVRQTQGEGQSNVSAFSMPVEIVVKTEGGGQYFQVENTAREQSYHFSVDSRPTGVQFDPNRLILRGDPVQVTAVDSLPILPNETDITRVYPNPTSGVLHVQIALGNDASARLVLYDVLGRQVKTLLERQLSPAIYVYTFDVAHLAAGRYFLRLETADGHTVRAVVIR